MSTAATALTIEREDTKAITPHQGQHVARQDANAAPMPISPAEMAFQLLSKGADPASVREMIALSKELAADHARCAFDAAVAAAKSEIPVIVKNAKGHNDKRYANFAAYAEVVDPIIARHGLSYRFKTAQADKITVTCILSHKDGHFEENSLSGPSDSSGSKNAIQAIGSTLTYLQRYTLIQALGLAASEDDDGNGGSARDGGGPITKEQLKELQLLIEEVGAFTPKFCEIYQIDALPDLPAKLFKDAVQNLRDYGRRQGK